jgi:hypothetical protein
MSTARLAKLYEHLTPLERLPLALAAEELGDEEEADRLARTAPRLEFSIPDCFGLRDGLWLLANFHMITQLERIAILSLGEKAVERRWENARGKQQVDRAKHVSDMLAIVAYRITVAAEVWKCFCAGLKIAPDSFLRDMPAYDTVQIGEEYAKALAPSAEGVRVLCCKAGFEPPDVEASAQGMRDLLDQHMAEWGCPTQ